MSHRHLLRSSVFVAAAGFMGLFAPRHARAIFITNLSFESPAANNTWAVDAGGTKFPFPFANPTGWSTTAAGSINVNAPSTAAYAGGVPDGTQTLAVGAGAAYQNTSTPITAGSTYTLNVYVGNRADYSGAGAVLLETSGGTVLKTSGTISPALGTFQDVILTYSPALGDPNIGQNLQVDLAWVSGNQAQFDNVVLTAVPEPTTLGILGISAIALLRRTTRNRRLRLA